MGDAGDQKDKRVRVTESENQGNQSKSNESQPRERADESKESDEEFLEPKEPPAPPAPTTAEWIEHQITHMPYKAWCPICVKNAAANNPHRMLHHSRGVAMFCMDYMFMTQKPTNEDLLCPTLVIKERVSNGVWALPVIRKGAYKSKIVKRVTEIINSVGSPEIIIKSDQKPAIVYLQKEIRRELWDEIIEISKQTKVCSNPQADRWYRNNREVL